MLSRSSVSDITFVGMSIAVCLASQLGKSLVDNNTCHLLDLGGNDPLPAENGPNSDEFQRIERHFDGHPVGDPPYGTGDERYTDVLPEIRVRKQ